LCVGNQPGVKGIFKQKNTSYAGFFKVF